MPRPARFADDPDQRREYAELTERADETLLAGIDDAFRLAFAIAGALALVGAFAVLPREARARNAALAATVAALALPAAHAVARPALEPEPVVIADPCAPRSLPATGGIDGFVQDAALTALDRAACRFGSSREELALALADEDEARAYERAHGVDPRSAEAVLDILGLRPGLSSQRSGTQGAAASAARSASSLANEPSSRRASQPTNTAAAPNGHGSSA